MASSKQTHAAATHGLLGHSQLLSYSTGPYSQAIHLRCGEIYIYIHILGYIWHAMCMMRHIMIIRKIHGWHENNVRAIPRQLIELFLCECDSFPVCNNIYSHRPHSQVCPAFCASGSWASIGKLGKRKPVVYVLPMHLQGLHFSLCWRRKSFFAHGALGTHPTRNEARRCCNIDLWKLFSEFFCSYSTSQSLMYRLIELFGGKFSGKIANHR